MKKMILMLLILFSSVCFPQTPPEKFDKKQIKIKIGVAGGCLIAGAVVNVIRTYQIEPTAFNNINSDKYNQTQKDYHRVSSMFYALSGISLIGICFNF